MNVVSRSLFFVTILLSAQSHSLYAEGVLLKSIPPNNAQLSQFDGKVILWFSGNVSDRYPSIVVANSEGQRVDNDDVVLTIAERSQLQVTTKALLPDEYAMRYRVVTEDGLVVSGIQKFTIKP